MAPGVFGSQPARLESATRAIYLPPFRIDLTTRPGVAVPVPGRRLAMAVAAALRAAGGPAPSSIGLVLSDDRELAELNAEHMGHAEPTDVLSFPLLAPDAFSRRDPGAGPRSGAAAPGFVFALPPGSRVHLGDIVVSVERAITQAEEGRGGQTSDIRWTAAEELLLLAVHGALHVCGWDHAEPAEEAAMRALEAHILADFGAAS
jgi:probable rRNA maturation factor